MILNITARNVNDAFESAVWAFHALDPIPESSRAGPVYRYPTPVCLEYERSNERVLFNSYRDANPFFHFMEGVWMLSGEDKVLWLSQFNDQIQAYSDDGYKLHGAYGKRWARHFNHDQIIGAIDHIRTLPNSRRVVIAMYDPNEDAFLNYRGKDVPCNTHIYMAVRDERRLDMTVMARSNDVIWGATGANAVHMSMLHEFIATQCRMELGSLYQFSNDYHIYAERFNPNELVKHLDGGQPYELIEEPTTPLCDYMAQPFDFLEECQWFIRGEYNRLRSPIWLEVGLPMKYAWDLFIAGEIDLALAVAEGIIAPDWRLACVNWLRRRM